MRSLYFILIALGPGFSFSANAEQLGTIKVDTLVVRPQFHLMEPAQGEFALGESLFSVRWRMDTRTSAILTLGAKDLIGTSVHFTDTLNEDLGFIEAYGEYMSDYGTFRAGLQPVRFGNEGDMREADLDMPRSLLFQERLVPLRDVGLGYDVDYAGYFTRLMVHNGESGANTDGRTWYTAAWGREEPGQWQVGLAGQTGSTKSDSTLLSQDTLAGVDPTKEALWRLGGPFAVWSPHRWRFTFEGYLGELVQDNDIHKFSTGHATLSYSWPKYFLGLRYDQFDPDQGVDSNREQRISLALGLLSERGTSRLYLIGTKVLEESHQVPNDELLLVWHLTPELPPESH